jgi:hypothetical protein
MTAYPDLVVKFDRLEPKGEGVLYHWTLPELIPARVEREVRFESADTKIGSLARMD